MSTARPACAQCGAAGAWTKDQSGYVCSNCSSLAPVPRRLPCSKCNTERRVDDSTLRRGQHWPYGDAAFVCRKCWANHSTDIQCTRQECQNTGSPATATPPEEYLCDACNGGWVYADCVSCQKLEKRELVYKADLLRSKRFDSLGEPRPFYICSACKHPRCRRCCVTRVPCSDPDSAATAASNTCTACTDPPPFYVRCQHAGCIVQRVTTECTRTEFFCAEHNRLVAQRMALRR
jgi:hypothetical protein